jgi:chromosomal replication initiation ATPase DnaA
MNVDILWKTILDDLKTTVTSASFHTLFSRTKLISFENGKAVVACDQPILLSIIEKKYATTIISLFKGTNICKRL